MKARPATERIRRFLLVGLVAVLAAIAGLYLLGRQGVAPEPEPTRSSEVPQTGDVVAVSDAFDFTQSIEGQPIFRIHGDSFSTGKDARVLLTGVRVELFREQRRYAVASERATYDPNTKGAELSGGARLEGEDGLSLTADGLVLGRGGELLEAAGSVRFEQSGKFRGEASGLAFDVPADTLVLAGPVKLTTTVGDPIGFEAERLEVDRKGRVVRLPGVLTLTRGGDRMQAGEGELFLAEKDDAPQLLSLWKGVAGTIADPGEGEPGRHLAVQATRLSLRFTTDGSSKPEEATLEGGGRDLALVESVGADADLIQGLASKGWFVKFENGVPHEAQSDDPVHFAEYRRGVDDAVRSGRSDNGRIEFSPAGEAERIVLGGRVELTDPAFRAWGERALFDVSAGRAEILGPKARIESERADLTAPHLVYTRETGVLNATDGVRAVLKKGAKEGLSGLGWSGEAPIQVEAREATLTDAPRGFNFRGDVRAWQGKNRLQSDQLRGSDSDRQLAAAGSVKTVWLPETQGATPVEITAGNVSYDESQRRLVYAGSVLLQQDGKTIRCDELAAELGEDRKIRSMRGSGKLELRDPTRGQKITGSTADYDVASGEVLVAGDPVRLEDAAGAVLTGKRLRYEMKTGAAKLLGAAS